MVPGSGLIARFEIHLIDGTEFDSASVAAFRNSMGSSHLLDKNGA
jgi:hypothetical protein